MKYLKEKGATRQTNAKVEGERERSVDEGESDGFVETGVQTPPRCVTRWIPLGTQSNCSLYPSLDKHSTVALVLTRVGSEKESRPKEPVRQYE